FSLVVLDPVAVIPPPANAIDCNSSGVVLTSTGSTPLGQASYGWQNSNWNFVGGTATYNATLTGTYYLVVTQTAGGLQCKDTASVVVTGNTTPPGATATGGNINCISNQVMLTSNSPTGGVNYTWTGPGINPGNQFLQNPTVSDPGVYVVTVKNPVNGCTSTATVTVLGDLTPPAASAAGGLITCVQSNVTIDGTTNVPTATWHWTGPGITPANQSLEDPNVTLSGTYNVTVTNTVNGCTNTASALVDQNTAIPTVSAGPDQTLTCSLPNTNLQGNGDGGGQPITFSWTGPNNFMSSIAQPNVNEGGTYILTVSNTVNGCVKNDTVFINVNQVLPNALAGADSIITCAEPSVTLVGSGSSQGANFTATWSGPGINAGNMNVYNPVVDAQGTYNLLITNTTNGCTSTDQVLVDINTVDPTASAGTDDQLTCTNPGGITLNGSGTPANITYLWTGPGIGANNFNIPNPTVTQPGTYDLLVTDPVNGCTATDQVIVTQDANVPTAAGGPDQTLNCTVTTVNFDGSGSSSGAGITYAWSGPGINGGNINAQSPSGLTVPGTYNLTVTNTNNSCQNTDVVVIQIDTISPNADAGNALILNCFNNATDTLDASASSTGSNFTLLWSGPGITPANQNLVNPVINNEPGTYMLVVTNTDNTCTASAQVNVASDLNIPVADAGTDDIIDCVITSTSIGGSSSNGPNFTYSWTGPGITPANQNLATPTVDEPGTYTIVVTNNINGCTATNDMVVTTNSVYPVALAGNDGLITCANPSAVLDGSASDIGANFQIMWTGPGINGGNQNQPAPSVGVPGTYILSITNTTNSCITQDTVVVAENTVIPAASAGLDIILNCQLTITNLDGSLSDVSPTIVYAWTGSGINGTNQNDQNPSIDQPGTYDLVVTDTENGCSDTDQVIVTQDNVDPTASAGADGLITCAQLTQVLDGSLSSTGAQITYVWEGPGINGTNFNLQSPTVSVSGTYTVTVTNTQNFCTAEDVVVVGLNQTAPAIAAGPDATLTCVVTTSQLDASQSASGPNITYAWTGPGIVSGQNTTTPTVDAPGAYVLTVTNTTNGCTSVDAVDVGEDILPPIVVAGADLILTCANAASGVTLMSTGSNVGANFAYLWSGNGINASNETLANPTVLVPGTYTLVITNTTNGCTDSDAAQVDADQNLPTANAGQDQIITCAITSAVLDGTGSSTPSGSLTYQWSGPGINGGNATNDMPTVLQSGIYSMTVTNAVTGCSATDQVEVLLDTQSPTIAATSEIITCTDPLSTVTVTSSAANSIYHWEGPDVNQGNNDNQTIQVDVAGLYAVTVTGPNGCTAVTSTIVEEDENLPQGAVEGTTLNCLNAGSSTISGQVLSPAGSTFTWTGPGIGTQTTETVTVNQPGVYTFTIQAPNGCIRPITVNVLADFQAPTIIAVANQEIDCNTSEVTINGAGTSTGPNFTYQWTTVINGNIVSGDNTLNPIVDRAGTYEILVTNLLNGCTATKQVVVEVDDAVPSGFDVEVRNIRCFGDVNGAINVNGVIGGTQPFFFTLSDASGVINQYTGLGAGEYTLALEDANGCNLDTTIIIADAGQLQVELGPNVEVSLGEEATVTAQISSTIGIQSVTWNYSPGCDSLSTDFCETFTYLPFDSYRHTITVVDNNGCIARDEVLVIVEKLRQVYVPNIFNPDSDVNFNLGVFVGIDVAKIKQFAIYDRWGDQVFQLDEYIPVNGDGGQAWDGTVRGDKGQLGVYVWYVEVEFIDGETKLFKGDVTLFR
ncbi:MAG: gliding motility-associated C-terminal domain-containing protein, partial [Saprospiraceae bacterium]|nr:gliding motility-associated C-terminal domain-containing protein [Saprospiraceae bacterium]